MNNLQQFLEQIIFALDSGYEFKVINAVLIVATIMAVWLLRWAIAQATGGIFEAFKISTDNKRTVKRFFNTLISFFAVLMILRTLGIDVENLLNYQLFSIKQGEEKEFVFHIHNIVNVALIYFFVRVVMWILDQALSTYYDRSNVDVGARYAINQVLKYIIYTSAILAGIQALGFDLTLIWGGAAALLVGFGLGLQQTFNDLVSGLLLLIERSVEVGDTLNMGGTIGVVERIGIRVSVVRDRDDNSILVPNSNLVTAQVINWTSQKHSSRFFVAVGVAYGSDTTLVKKLLLEVINQHEKVETYPTPYVIFSDFGASSLDFQVYFWSKELMSIERVKSDIRFEIDRVFREHQVEVPFPQQDIWFRNSMKQ